MRDYYELSKFNRQFQKVAELSSPKEEDLSLIDSKIDESLLYIKDQAQPDYLQKCTDILADAKHQFIEDLTNLQDELKNSRRIFIEMHHQKVKE